MTYCLYYGLVIIRDQVETKCLEYKGYLNC